MTNKFTVGTEDQRVLFVYELTGQLSDGHWENARPSNHWRSWCDAEVLVGENIGVNFWSSRVYDFASSDLLDVVGTRMRLYVMIWRAFQNNNVIKLLEHLFTTINDLSEAVSEPVYSGLPQYEGEYWDKVRDTIADFCEENGGLEAVIAKVLAQSYSANDLRRDLKALNLAQRVKSAPN
jgi:hypothetical protein